MEDTEDLGQGDDGSQGTSQMTDILIVSPFFMTVMELKKVPHSYRSDFGIKNSEHVWRKSVDGFQALRINNGKRSISGQLSPVETNQLT